MRSPLVLNPEFHRVTLLSWLFATFLLASGISATTKKPPLQPINLNAATSEELQLVPGIGPATAEKILLMRKSYGAFKSVDDLLAIRGIGKKRLDKMRKYLVAGRPASGVKPSSGTPRSPQPASCVSCGNGTPFLKDAALPASSATKVKASAEKPTDAPSERDEEPQLQ
jgi:competence ComEA-like helix-hairpin-helix protein